MSEGHVRIRDSEEFKRLVNEKKPGSITFILIVKPGSHLTRSFHLFEL